MFPTHVVTLALIEALLLALAGGDRRRVFASLERLASLRDALGNV